jgi:hypothetical protein
LHAGVSTLNIGGGHPIFNDLYTARRTQVPISKPEALHPEMAGEQPIRHCPAELLLGRANQAEELLAIHEAAATRHSEASSCGLVALDQHGQADAFGFQTAAYVLAFGDR